MPKSNYSKRHRDAVARKLGPSPHRQEVSEAADLLDVSKNDIRRWIREFLTPSSGSAQEQRSTEPSVSIHQSDDLSEALYETVSFYLPSDLVDLCRELADARLRVARGKKKAAQKISWPLPRARRSASGVVKEALSAYRNEIEMEIKSLNKQSSLSASNSESEVVSSIERDSSDESTPFFYWSRELSQEEHAQEIISSVKNFRGKTFESCAEFLNMSGKGTREGRRWSAETLRKFLRRHGIMAGDL